MAEPARHDSFEEDEVEDEKDMLLRQSRVLYPEVEEWILIMAVSAYLKQKQLNPDINFRSLNINEECNNDDVCLSLIGATDPLGEVLSCGS
jgi:hypothetical protein